ncbi:MAG: glycosyltransferase [Planctomycetota bacterium]
MIATVLAWAAPILASMAAALWLYFNLHPIYSRNLRHRIEPSDIGDALLPPVALVVPGRDEAEHLPDTLASICEQDYPSLRVVFVDDASTDATPRLTAELAQRYPDRLTVVRNQQDPPAGWVGKPWAIHEGIARLADVEQAGEPRATYLCFTDADIHWAPHCLRSAMAHLLAERADICGLFPRLTFGSPLEAIPQLQMVTALGLLFPFEKAMDPKIDDALIGGGFILVRRDLYEAVDGHAAVADKVLEDIELGRVLKRAGGRLTLGFGSDLQWCRMYDGWADQWEGLTKNTYAAVQHNPLFALGAVLAVIAFNILPPVYAVGGLVWLYVSAASTPVASAGDPKAWLTFFAGTTAYLGGVRVTNAVRKVLALQPWYAYTLPLGSIAAGLFLLGSAWQYHTGGNRWKGRRYKRASPVND